MSENRLKGIEICERYFEEFGRKMLERNYSEMLDHIACGLAGMGSDCLGFDDELSADHDFGPGFCIWVEDGYYEEYAPLLTESYNSLPSEYLGYKRHKSIQGSMRTGVMRLSDFLMSIIGSKKLPRTEYEWNRISDDRLGLLLSGKIFMDKAGFMENIRKKIRNERPFADRLAKLSAELELMAQSGQYNYNRMLKRGDKLTASLYKSEFIKSSIRAWHLINNLYAPYEKWLFTSLKKNGGEKLAGSLERLVSGEDCFEEICEYIADEAVLMGLCREKAGYLADMADDAMRYARLCMLADDITELEFKLFDMTNNTGGRAECQDDWGTFSRMRRSQYYTFTEDLLRSIKYDFETAFENGRNVITEKYAFMMESTAPDEFDKIKSKLPSLSEKFIAVREGIISIQVEMMEKFSEEYPRIAGNARAIHTSEDNPFFTSYETYLRGELSTYSMDSLVLYGKLITGLLKKGESLPKMIMTNSVHMYGFKSLDQAEKKQ